MNSLATGLLRVTLFVGLLVGAPSAQAALIGHYTFDTDDIDWDAGSGQIHDSSRNGNHGDAHNLTAGNALLLYSNGVLRGTFDSKSASSQVRATEAYK